MNRKFTQQYKTEQWLPIGIEEAWNFFSSPFNLSKITPKEMDFKILSPSLPSKIYQGMLIDYTVKPLFGIPVQWTTEIVNLSENQYFTDRQLKGPFKIWEHTHTFEPENGGVKMSDVVVYELPLGHIGLLAHQFVVMAQIEFIFKYRSNTLLKLFST